MTVTVYYISIFIVLFFKIDNVFSDSVYLQYNHSFEFNRPDFAEVSRTKYFVDKSAMILDVYNHPSPIVITVPRRFGKSVNADMIKRFFEIEVDDEGNEVTDKTKTSNYKLFTNLVIYKKYRPFFDANFGKHPVVYINYGPLLNITGICQVMDGFRVMISNAFKEHAYLRNISSLWLSAFNKTHFDTHLYPAMADVPMTHVMREGFPLLFQILRHHFRKRVFVIIDEYDALIETHILGHVEYLMRMGSRICRLFTDRLIDPMDDNLHTVMLTGSLRIRRMGMSPLGQNVREKVFLENHVFSKHYGLTEEEVNRLLKIDIKNETDRRLAKGLIDDFYGGYMVRGNNIQIYNLGSVIRHLEEGRKPKGYWYEHNYFNFCQRVFHAPLIRDEIKKLVLGKTIKVNVSKSITKYNIIRMHRLYYNLTIVDGIDWLTRFFYGIGYLTLHDRYVSASGLTDVEVPNWEIKYHMITILQDVCRNLHGFSDVAVKQLHLAIDSFLPESIRYEIFRDFYDALKNFLQKSKRQPKSEVDIQSALFIFLFPKFPFSRTHLTTLYSEDNIITGKTTDLIIVNKNVAIYMGISTVEGVHEQTPIDFVLMAQKRLFLTYCNYSIVGNTVQLMKKTYIGLVIQPDEEKITMSCSTAKEERDVYLNSMVINK